MSDRDFRKELDTSDNRAYKCGYDCCNRYEESIREEWVYELLDEIDGLREELARLKAANGSDDDGNPVHTSISTGE